MWLHFVARTVNLTNLNFQLDLRSLFPFYMGRRSHDPWWFLVNWPFKVWGKIIRNEKCGMKIIFFSKKTLIFIISDFFVFRIKIAQKRQIPLISSFYKNVNTHKNCSRHKNYEYSQNRGLSKMRPRSTFDSKTSVALLIIYNATYMNMFFFCIFWIIMSL